MTEQPEPEQNPPEQSLGLRNGPPEYSQDHLDEIERIARLVAPEEACGILVGVEGLVGSVSCIPLANEAPPDERRHSYALSAGVVKEAIRDWLESLPHNYLRPGINKVQVLLWHSHPGPASTKGPSGKDLELREANADLPHLVCALADSPADSQNLADPPVFVRY